MTYYPYLPITWVNRFIEGMKINPNVELTSKSIKKLGISEPGRLTKSFKFIGLLSNDNKLTGLGKRFIDFRTRKEACREILEKPPYDELVFRMKNGEFLSRKQLRQYFRSITGWTVDPVDKTISLLLFFLKYADYEVFRENEFIQSAQTSPRLGSRKGKKTKKIEDIIE